MGKKPELIKEKIEELSSALLDKNAMTSSYNDLLTTVAGESGYSKKTIRAYVKAVSEQRKDDAAIEANELIELLGE